MVQTSKDLFERRKQRARYALKKSSKGKLRISVFRSARNINAQLIDDQVGKTLASASSNEKLLLGKLKNTGNVEAASQVGKLLGERIKELGIEAVVFDRGGYRFHGRVKALADGAREAGLQF